MQKSLVTKTAQNLIDEGTALIATRHPEYGTHVDPIAFAKWLPNCRNLLRMLGPYSNAYLESFDGTLAYCDRRRCKTMVQALIAIKEAASDNLFVRAENLIFAETCSDLMDQADELASKGYLLAAGVICRAVFEEHLRRLCNYNQCMPTGRPTIESLKQALARASVFSKIDVKVADAIAASGNHCAHNVQPPLGEPDIRKLIIDVISFVAGHPLE